MPPAGSEPFSWSVDRVVHELCSPEGILQNSESGRRHKYDFKSLEIALRENEIDGEIFVSEVTDTVLQQVLGVKSFGQRSGILKVQRQLRNCSATDEPKQLSKPHQQHSELDLASLHAQVEELTSLVKTSIANRNIHSTGGVHDIPETGSLEDKKETGSTVILDAQVDRDESVATKNPKRPQKRVAPTLVSDVQAKPHLLTHNNKYFDEKPMPVDEIFYYNTSVGEEIQYGVDESGDFVLEQSKTSAPGLSQWVNARMKYYLKESPHPSMFKHKAHVKEGLRAYPEKLANGKVPSITLIVGNGSECRALRVKGTRWHETKESMLPTESPIPEEVSPSKNEQASLLLRPVPHGSVNSVPGSYPSDKIVPDVPDPSYDAFLDYLESKYETSAYTEIPVNFDSDSESLDSETWEEIQQDRDREEDLQKPDYLSQSEVADIIKEARAELEKEWLTKKLPALQPKGHRIWMMSRIYPKERARNLETLESQIRHLEARSANLEAWIKDNRFKTKQELEGLCGVLKHTVWDKCALKWRIDILKSKEAPQKIDAFVKPKKPHRMVQDIALDEEDLTDSDTGAEDFIVPDTVSKTAQVMEVDDAEGVATQSEVGSELPAVQRLQQATVEEQHTTETDDQSQRNSSREPSVGHDSVNEPMTGPGITSPINSAFDAVDVTGGPNIIDLTVSDIDVETPVNTPLNELSKVKTEKALKNTDKSLITSTEHEVPVWKEPPQAPPPRSPPSGQHDQDVSLETESNDETDADDLNENLTSADKKTEDTSNSPLPPHTDIYEILKLKVSLLNELRDERRILAWFIGSMPKERRFVEEFIRGKMDSEVQPDVWEGMENIKKHGSRIRGEPDNVSQAKRTLGTWFIAWTARTIADQREGWLVKQVKRALETYDEYEEYYQCVHDLLLSAKGYEQRMKGGQESRPATNSRKRLLLAKTDSEGEEREPKKLRKWKSTESQDAKALRASVTQRRKLLAERQRELALKLDTMRSNNVSDSHPVVNLSKTEGDEDILLNEHLGQRIFPYQLGGIQFLWTEIVTAQEQQGCLLAQPMGMGKTVQTIALLVTITEAARSSNANIRQQIPKKLQTLHFLIICPPTLVDNWLDELLMWVPPSLRKVLGDNHVTGNMSLVERLHRINQLWADQGGILLMSSSIFRDLICNRKVSKGRKSMDLREEEQVKYILTKEQHAEVHANLVTLPSLVIFDEAQDVKGMSSKIAMAAKQIRTQSRIALTGSPLSNNVEEYYRIIDWVAPNYLGDAREFRAKFAEPIAEGMYADASNSDKRLGLKRLSLLKTEIAPKVHRDELSVLRDKLPGKTEFVIRIHLTQLQSICYNALVQSILERTSGGKEATRASIWAYLEILRLLCSHPYCFERKLVNAEKVEVSQGNIPPSSTEIGLDAEKIEVESQRLLDGDRIGELLTRPMIEKQVGILKSETDLTDLKLSFKMSLLFQILTEVRRKKEKTLVFSHSLATLNYVQRMLDGGFDGTYTRLDGSTAMKARQDLTKNFNKENSAYDICLISTRAGGTGLNLFGASRVIILDETFNPTYEKQAIGRAYRIGQKKHVYVYRLIVSGTFEDIMQNQANFKTDLASRVVDKKDTVRSASKGLREWIFPPKAIPTEDISGLIGKDPDVLDNVIKATGENGGIQSILLAESLLIEESEALTREEEEEISRERLLLQLRRTDPVAYDKELRKEQSSRLDSGSSSILVGKSTFPSPQAQNPSHQTKSALSNLDQVPPAQPKSHVIAADVTSASSPQISPIEASHRTSNTTGVKIIHPERPSIVTGDTSSSSRERLRPILGSGTVLQKGDGSTVSKFDGTVDGTVDTPTFNHDQCTNQ